MTTTIIITLCTLLLFAYFFDITASRSRIPSVIFLLMMGWGLKQMTQFLSIAIPDMSPVLPVLGTIGLILIVLEGSLELEVNRSKFGVMKKAAIGAGLSALGIALAAGFAFHLLGDYPFKNSFANAIPLAIISSAIAIPTARSLSATNREFIIYESSLSDIFGVILFNFVLLNEVINAGSFVTFGLELVLMAVLSLVATVGLATLLNRIQHPVKFIPIILFVLLIYGLSKLYHLPSLLFILVFGLFLGNLEALQGMRWIKRFRLTDLHAQVGRFHELIGEIAFLVRAIFFILFGYTLETSEILDVHTLSWSAGIVALIYGVRVLQLRLSGLPLSPLLFIAPRGLITILLFISIGPEQVIPIVNRSLLTQVILLTALVMMVGVIASPNTAPTTPLRNGEGEKSH